MQTQKNKNTIAIIIGLGLILLIFAVTLARPFFSKKKPAANPFSFSRDASSVNQISADDLLNKMHGKIPVIVIDVRGNDDFQKEHILDSQNIPLDSFGAAFDALDKSRDYAIVDSGVDNSGLFIARSLAGAQSWVKNIYYLAGGFSAWKNEANPTVSAGNPNSFIDQSKVSYINSEQLKSSMQGENNLFLLDVRKSEAYADEHIPGAVNIFLDNLEKKRREIPLGKKIILYDNDGLWAFQAAVRLFDMGTLNVYALSDGFNAWKQKNYPVAK